MKHVKRFFIGLILVIIGCIIINANTRFFKDIDTYIPFLAENFPAFTEQITNLSDEVNKKISHIPTPREFIAKITNKELPIDPDDVAYNIYFSSDTMLNFYSSRNISVCINGDYIDVYGVSDNPNDKYLIYRFLDINGNVLSDTTDTADGDGKFGKRIKIPDNANQLAVFTGNSRYGKYTSEVYDYIYLLQSNGWEFTKSPVYESNVEKYEKAKSKSYALKNTYDICHKEPEISDLAKSITRDCKTDYDKALGLHDWVAKNIYYDKDSIDTFSNNAPYVASDVLETGRAVCLGYSNLYAALCRSVGLPCNVVTGYAIGASTGVTQWSSENVPATEGNHAWNEVYVDNRWVIVDTTWDSRNTISDGVKATDENISHLYFDSNLKFFSTNHKIIEYIK